MTELHIAHTADLGADQKTAIRSLVDAVFDGVSDDTFGNALGGVHAMVLSGGELIGHGSVVQRRMLHVGRTLRTGYVEGVAVRADRRRQGHGVQLMEALERVVRSGSTCPANSPATGARPRCGEQASSHGSQPARQSHPRRVRFISRKTAAENRGASQRRACLLLPIPRFGRRQGLAGHRRCPPR
jgi:GNAT superfamily N-acetyltransferase